MQYLISVIDDGTGPDTPAEQAAVDAFNERAEGCGPLGLRRRAGSPDAATTIDNRGAGPVSTDGPFVEAKEHVAGLWIIEADDLDVALRLGAAGSRACHRKAEVRPFL